MGRAYARPHIDSSDKQVAPNDWERAEKSRRFLELAGVITPMFVIVAFVVIGDWGAWPAPSDGGLLIYGLAAAGLIGCIVALLRVRTRQTRRRELTRSGLVKIR